MIFQILRFSEIESVYKKVSSLLDQDIKILDRRVGWHQFLGEKKVGDVATAQGILILSYINRKHRLINNLVSTLHDSQITSTGSSDYGGWSFLSNRDSGTLEPTAWALLGLIASGELSNSQTMTSGTEWIIKNQNTDGGWGPRQSLKSRIYCTFLACKVLRLIEPRMQFETDGKNKEVIQYLFGSQNPDGGWGCALGEPSTPVHTSFAIITLSQLGIDSHTIEIQKGIKYIYSQWKSDTKWENTTKFEQYEVPKSDTAWTRITFNHFPTAWVIIALLENGETIFKSEIFDSIKWIIQSQSTDGSWSLQDVPKNRLWAIHDAILAINSFLDKAVTAETIERMVLLDDILVLTKGGGGKGFQWLLISFSLFILIIGSIIGALVGSATELHTTLGPWVQHYWAWVILVLYLLSALPLAKFRIINWKDALIGIFFPGILIIVQIYLTK